MSKWLKDKICVYCSAQPSTRQGDHIFARSFFLERHRGNLPKVPACIGCNEKKSVLEHYLSTVLPLGGRHTHALENLEKNVPRKLEKNIKLKNALSFGMSNINLVNDKTLGASVCFPLETEKIERLFNFITRALCYHHFQKLVPDDLQIRVLLLSEFGDNFFNEIFSKIPSNAEHHALGDGTFEYRCISSVPPKDISVWQFKIYGGVYLGGDPSAPNDISTTVGAFVGNPDFLEQLNL